MEGEPPVLGVRPPSPLNNNCSSPHRLDSVSMTVTDPTFKVFDNIHQCQVGWPNQRIHTATAINLIPLSFLSFN